MECFRLPQAAVWIFVPSWCPTACDTPVTNAALKCVSRALKTGEPEADVPSPGWSGKGIERHAENSLWTRAFEEDFQAENRGCITVLKVGEGNREKNAFLES